jgi:hypothetical protein
MKPIIPHRSYDPDTSRILARLRKADNELKNKERILRTRCANLLRRHRQRERQRARAREAQLLLEVGQQVGEWKKECQLTEERRIAEVVRSVLVVFLQNDGESKVLHIVRAIQTILYQQPAHQSMALRVSPDLEHQLKSAFPKIQVIGDPELKGATVVVQTPSGEMEYSWERHLQSILDLL